VHPLQAEVVVHRSLVVLEGLLDDLFVGSLSSLRSHFNKQKEERKERKIENDNSQAQKERKIDCYR
jgi:hypothetical protein